MHPLHRTGFIDPIVLSSIQGESVQGGIDLGIDNPVPIVLCGQRYGKTDFQTKFLNQMQEKPTPPCIHVDEPIKPIDVSSVPSPKLVFPCVIRAQRSKFTRHIGAKQAKKQLKYELDRTPPANYLPIFRKLLRTPLNAFPSGVYEHFITDLLFRIRKHSVPESLTALAEMEAYTNETQQQLSSVAPEGSLPQPTDL